MHEGLQCWPKLYIQKFKASGHKTLNCKKLFQFLLHRMLKCQSILLLGKLLPLMGLKLLELKFL